MSRPASRAPRAAVRALRHAQQRDAAGDPLAAEAGFAEARSLAPHLRGLAVQEALSLARRGDPAEALARLAAAPPTEQAGVVWRLFHGWLLARIGQAGAAREALLGVVAEAPENRVATDALAYALLREGRSAEAVRVLDGGFGDNLELLSWTWAELERAALALPRPPEPPLPPVSLPRPVGRATAARWLRAGMAAAMGHENVLVRRRLLAAGERSWLRPLTPLLRRLEQHWPTDALYALRLARASGHKLPELALYLGAELYDRGHAQPALDELDRALEQMADSPERWQPLLYRAAALVDLRRWDDAERALAEAARAEREDADEASEADQAAGLHEFAAPDWYLLRARLRLAQGVFDEARADLTRALDADPALFDARFERLRATLADAPPPTAAVVEEVPNEA